MTPELALEELNYIFERQQGPERDVAADHGDADEILCELLSYLGYDEIVNAYQSIDKYYG